MFHLYYGNDLRGLAARLGERIADVPADRLLAPEIVLVPQPGMRRWLEIELAEARGVIANIDFRLPGQFVWQVLRANHSGLPWQSFFDREILRWRLMPLLAELAREPVGDPIAHYLRGDAEQLKRLQLAREFAAALERYQAYRRDLLAGWERGAEPGDWQAEAWRRLVRASDEPHRAHLIGEFLVRHGDEAAVPQGLPQRLSVFGCINISPDALRVLGTIAAHCELHFYLPSPCAEYWGDERSLRERLLAGASPLQAPEQPLLASWGRVGREFFEQVFSYDEVQPASEEAVVREPSRATLLGRIQADILHLRAPDIVERRAGVEADDASLRVHVCHSPLREMQVLHDQLLALFARDATLKPRDIAVMMPDVAKYTAAIDAVFGALPPGDARRIPYTIADRRAQDEHPIVEVFLTLLNLPTSRWTLREVLDLIAVPAVQRRLGLDDEALDNLERWLAAAGVRWGLDASTRIAFGAGDYRAFTWAEGIERLLIGYATGTTERVAGIEPVPEIEGSAATALGHALHVLRELERLAVVQGTPHRADEWQFACQRTLDALFAIDTDEREERRALDRIREALAALADNARAGGCEEALDWQTVRAFIAERLAETDPQQRFLRGGVSFCGMVPLRAIPFRVIALLGLDDEAFPRRETENGISRLRYELRHDRKLGDRSVRDDDRYLFLQLLTSADDVLHLSYVGRDLRTGSARQPSALVAELLGVVCRDYFADAEAARKSMRIEHPLQPFARAVFDGTGPGVFTYRDEWRAAAGACRSGALHPFVRAHLPLVASEPSRRITLDRLIEFWRNPSRAFLRDVLHLDLYEDDERIEDDDPLDLNGLDNWKLKHGLIAEALESGSMPPVEADAAFQVRWQLPVGRAGADSYRQQAGAARPIVARILDWRRRKTALPPAVFELALDHGWILECALRQPYREGLLHWTPSELRGSHWIRPWIEYLALAACADRAQLGFDADVACTQIGLDRKKTLKTVELRGIDAATARRELAGLLRGYELGQGTPLAFFPKSAWVYLQTLADIMGKDISEEKALAKAHAQFSGVQNEYSFPENRDAWIALAFRDRDPFGDVQLIKEFEQLALSVFGELAGSAHGATR